jgi:hypothetical protein
MTDRPADRGAPIGERVGPSPGDVDAGPVDATSEEGDIDRAWCGREDRGAPPARSTEESCSVCNPGERLRSGQPHLTCYYAEFDALKLQAATPECEALRAVNPGCCERAADASVEPAAGGGPPTAAASVAAGSRASRAETVDDEPEMPGRARDGASNVDVAWSCRRVYHLLRSGRIERGDARAVELAWNELCGCDEHRPNHPRRARD